MYICVAWFSVYISLFPFYLPPPFSLSPSSPPASSPPPPLHLPSPSLFPPPPSPPHALPTPYPPAPEEQLPESKGWRLLRAQFSLHQSMSIVRNTCSSLWRRLCAAARDTTDTSSCFRSGGPARGAAGRQCAGAEPSVYVCVFVYIYASLFILVYPLNIG